MFFYTILLVLNYILIISTVAYTFKSLFKTFVDGGFLASAATIVLLLVILCISQSVTIQCSFAQAYPEKFKEAGYSMINIFALLLLEYFLFSLTIIIKAVVSWKLNRDIERNQCDENYLKWNQWMKNK